MERHYGICIEVSCAACKWEAIHGYVRDVRTGNMVTHDHDPRYEVSLVWGRHAKVIFKSERSAEPVTQLPREFWTVEKY